MYKDWLVKAQLINRKPRPGNLLFEQCKKQTSATPKREVNLKSWASAESVPSASMWLVVNQRFMSMASFPESEELRNQSKTHISTGHFKKGKTSLILLKFLKCSLLLNASTTLDWPVAQNTFFFFAKWEVALVGKSSGVDMEVDFFIFFPHPNLVSIRTKPNSSGYQGAEETRTDKIQHRVYSTG